MTSLITVIIPCYNASKFIHRSILSLKKQTYTNFKCILIDDCSTDNTKKIILKKINNDKRFQLISLNQNRGVAFARNYAIFNSHTKYIATLDSDDAYLPEHLSLRLNYIENHNVDYLFGTMKIIGDKTVPNKNNPKEKIDILTETSQGPTMFIKRESFFKVGGYRQLYGEDGDFMERAIKCGLIIHQVPFITYLYYRDNNSSITKLI